MKKIITYLHDKVGGTDAYRRILYLEEQQRIMEKEIDHLQKSYFTFEKEINGLKMEANILYAKLMTVDDVIK